MRKFYSLCEKVISVDLPGLSEDFPLWKEYEVSGENALVAVSCQVGERLPSMEGGKVSPKGVRVACEGDVVYRFTPMGTREGALLRYSISDSNSADCFFTHISYRTMTDDRYLWSSIGLGQLLLPHRALLFHSSFIEYEGKGIIFTAESGVGKSTQAALWEKYMGAFVVNGDKSGVTVDEKGVYVHGVPFCGTSGICHKARLPLGAIVLLEQSAENRAERLTGFEAVRGLMKNLLLDYLAPGETNRTVALLGEMLSSVPVYRLRCTPDEGAVRALLQAMKRVDTN